jgi:hypothetical protein
LALRLYFLSVPKIDDGRLHVGPEQDVLAFEIPVDKTGVDDADVAFQNFLE